MIKRVSRFIMKTLCICMLFTASTKMAYAYVGTVAYSDWTIHTTTGVNSQAIVQSHTKLNGFTTVKTQDGSNFPVGYLGASVNIYNSGGALVKVSDWFYNTSPTNEWTVGTSSDPSSGSYYSRGAVLVFDGSSYVHGGFTARTPNVNY